MFVYKHKLYPDYLKWGNACQYIIPVAKEFCKGVGLDIGAGPWCFPGAIRHDIEEGGAYQLPDRKYLYIFSSHCLEHLDDPIGALEIWRDHIQEGGSLFLYLPHPEMVYWRPQNCRKHRHIWRPNDMAEIVQDLGFINVLHSERDLAWSFSVVGEKGNNAGIG